MTFFLSWLSLTFAPFCRFLTVSLIPRNPLRFMYSLLNKHLLLSGTFAPFNAIYSIIDSIRRYMELASIFYLQSLVSSWSVACWSVVYSFSIDGQNGRPEKYFPIYTQFRWEISNQLLGGAYFLPTNLPTFMKASVKEWVKFENIGCFESKGGGKGEGDWRTDR